MPGSPTEPDRLEVMQADRQRAADVYCDWFATGDQNATVRAIRDGERDDHLFVQAFARHRIETNSRTGDTVGERLPWFCELDDRVHREVVRQVRDIASIPIPDDQAIEVIAEAVWNGLCDSGAIPRAPQPITPPEVGGWDHRFRRLEEGELIEESDEHMLDDGSWELTNCAGQKAPDPNYTSHRWYRRLKVVPEVEGTTTCQSISGGRSASSTSIDARPADTKAGPEVGGELVERVAAFEKYHTDNFYELFAAQPLWRKYFAKAAFEAGYLAALSAPEVVDGTAGLVEALEKARNQFAFYGQQHRAKLVDSTPTTAWLAAQKKAEVNEGLVREFDAILSQNRGVS